MERDVIENKYTGGGGGGSWVSPVPHSNSRSTIRTPLTASRRPSKRVRSHVKRDPKPRLAHEVGVSVPVVSVRSRVRTGERYGGATSVLYAVTYYGGYGRRQVGEPDRDTEWTLPPRQGVVTANPPSRNVGAGGVRPSSPVTSTQTRRRRPHLPLRSGATERSVVWTTGTRGVEEVRFHRPSPEPQVNRDSDRCSGVEKSRSLSVLGWYYP